jgi:hypothetical protein
MGSEAGERVDDDAQLANYLIRVRRAARRLPRDRREWVIGRAGDWIAAALDTEDLVAGDAEDTEDTARDDVTAVLTRLGDPRQLVQAMDGHIPGDEARWPDHLAVLLLVIGGLAFLPAWVGGVVLLWASSRWRLKERLIGTLIWPGGLAGFWFLVTGPSVARTFGLGLVSFPALTPRLSLSLASYRPNALFWLTLAVLTAAEAIVGIWLIRRARSPELLWPWESVRAPGAGTDLS